MIFGATFYEKLIFPNFGKVTGVTSSITLSENGVMGFCKICDLKYHFSNHKFHLQNLQIKDNTEQTLFFKV